MATKSAAEQKKDEGSPRNVPGKVADFAAKHSI